MVIERVEEHMFQQVTQRLSSGSLTRARLSDISFLGDCLFAVSWKAWQETAVRGRLGGCGAVRMLMGRGVRRRERMGSSRIMDGSANLV